VHSSGTPQADLPRSIALPVTVSLAAVLVAVRSPFAFLLPLLRWCAEAFGLGA
jgi:hypothetical protein